MHELAICQALVSQVNEIARSRAARVHAVRVGLGPLAGIEPRLLAAAYPLAGAGTAVEGSRLAIETTLLRVRCRACEAETTPLPNRLVCGACGDWRTDLVTGDEMLLLSVELDVPETALETRDV
jgi:hydrogenase nickel incorporation protein HypA/HybF